MKSLVESSKHLATKRFYISLVIDLIFLLIIVQIGAFAERYSSTVTDLSSALSGSFLILLALILSYSFLKYLFLRLINFKMSYLEVLWKHTVSALILAVVIFFVSMIPTQISNRIIIPENLDRIRFIIAMLFYLLGYLVFTNSQIFMQNTNNLFMSLWNGLKSIKKTFLKMLAADIFFLAVAFIIANILVFIFKLLPNQSYGMFGIYNSIVQGVYFIMVSLWLSVNKFIVFDVKLSKISFRIADNSIKK
ncbi:hypothetical protein H6503_06385 [Candidatus Woesearchaeota archaeon]|nr:hypothetical protein [Candidatus Woesearchaeota archaeon]